MHDIIIVGAGLGRLRHGEPAVADPARRVCLIEAGPPDRNPFIHIPLGLALLARSRRLNWSYATDPEPGLNGRRLYWPRGRVLGGSSSINAMIYMRGHPPTTQAGPRPPAPAWDWPAVRQIFLDLEGNTGIADDTSRRRPARWPSPTCAR